MLVCMSLLLAMPVVVVGPEYDKVVSGGQYYII